MQYSVCTYPSSPTSQSLIQPKYGSNRAIFPRLKNATPDSYAKLHAITAALLSNGMRDSDTISSLKVLKGYTKPTDHALF